MKTHKIEIGIILAGLILISCTACNKENKSVPTMATVSSMSSDIEVSSLADSVTSSAVSSAVSSSPSSAVSKASSSSTTASKSASSSTTKKPSGGSTAKPSVGGSTTHTGGSTGGSTHTGGSTTKPSGGGSTGGGTTPAPVQPAGISTVGYASKYGCQSQDQYNYVRQRASSVGYSQDDLNQSKEMWSQAYSVPYSDVLNEALCLLGSVPTTGGSSENAYNVFASRNGSCVGRARAAVAILQTHGYNAKVVYGQNSGGGNHAWVTFQCGGTWYTGLCNLAVGNAPAGYHIDSISYQ